MKAFPQGHRAGGGGAPENGSGADESPLVKEIEGLAHLLFEWPMRQAPRLALPCCLFIAAMIQAGMIILFSITYRAPSENLPSAPQIYFLPPDSPIAREINPWLQANDPAVFSPQYDTRDAFPAPPPLTYRPSYEEQPPPLRPFPAALFSAMEVTEPPPMPLMRWMQQKSPSVPMSDEKSPVAPSPETFPTVVHWQDDLADRTLGAPASEAGRHMPKANAPTAKPALYEVEVSAEGLPLHCVLLDSSGDPSSDEAGSVWIHAQRFQPADNDTWGRVLILWGDSSIKTP